MSVRRNSYAGLQPLEESPQATGERISPFKPQGTAITRLTDSSGGTASNTIVDVPAAYTEATLANIVASLTAKVNELIDALRRARVIP